MERFEVITSDEKKVGRVVGVEDDNLIVERGLLRKTRHAVPSTFAETDESKQVVRLSVSKQLVESSPKLENGSVDRSAVAAHYGLAEGEPAPETAGYGDVTPDDPALSAEQQELRSGVEPAAQRRAEIREQGGRPSGDADPPRRENPAGPAPLRKR
jgi:hypothetical protein